MAETTAEPTRQSGASKALPDEVAAIPLLEERLSVAKRQVESGRVRVHVTVEEREEIITQQLSREDLHVERVPKNERVADVPHVRLEGNVTIVPVVKEVVVVEKALVLVEEIHISRRSITEEQQIPVTVRSEHAKVERDSDASATTTAE